MVLASPLSCFKNFSARWTLTKKVTCLITIGNKHLIDLITMTRCSKSLNRYSRPTLQIMTQLSNLFSLSALKLRLTQICLLLEWILLQINDLRANSCHNYGARLVRVVWLINSFLDSILVCCSIRGPSRFYQGQNQLQSSQHQPRHHLGRPTSSKRSGDCSKHRREPWRMFLKNSTRIKMDKSLKWSLEMR